MRRTQSYLAGVSGLVALVLILIWIPRFGPAAAPESETITIYRDTYGVPHIYADNTEAGLYAVGYAQAEDRLEELLKNYLRATGEMAKAFGFEFFNQDVQSRLWAHYEIARKHYPRIVPSVRRHIEAYVEGINAYLSAHPDEVPAWWGARRVDPYMSVAHAREFMWGWPLGQALSDLRAGGVNTGLTTDARSSNQWAVAPSRSALKAPILLIDPHLSWWGATRFWEFRIHAGELNGSGFNIPGSPYIGLGHNDHVAWAMTTGGPDTADIYFLTLNPFNPLQYWYDNGWRPLQVRKIQISVKGESKPREVTSLDSHNGPVVAKRGNLAYVAKLAYADEVQFAEAFYHFNFAKNIAEFKKGLELLQLMPQNVMAADTGGTIFYQRTGRVPVRPAGYDFSRPVDGSTSKTEWLGLHPAADLISMENPKQGYMQNCNIPPDVMMIGSPLAPDLKRFYLFNQKPGVTQARGARAVQLLSQDEALTAERAIQYALDVQCIGYDRWLEALKKADAKFGKPYKKENTDYSVALADLLQWDGQATQDSTAALKFYYWQRGIESSLGSKGHADLRDKINDYRAILGRGPAAPVLLTEREARSLPAALDEGIRTLRRRHKHLDARYGDVFRVGRDDKSWPVDGGSLSTEAMATLRAIGFGPERDDHTRWGRSGQASTQVVALTRPIQSWTQPPIGQSDRPSSPFYRDQGEKLFSRRRMKSTWYDKAELSAHIYGRTELTYKPRP